MVKKIFFSVAKVASTVYEWETCSIILLRLQVLNEKIIFDVAFRYAIYRASGSLRLLLNILYNIV